MVGSTASVRAGAREIKQFKDADRRERSSVLEIEDAEMRRYRASSVRAVVAESAIY
jgi:hypothetical protein